MLDKKWPHTYNAFVNVELVAWVRRLAKSGAARALRESTGFSASEVARELGVSPATVCRWERGLAFPENGTLSVGRSS
jgi:DNA-binding transcriptional regulator YiaG